MLIYGVGAIYVLLCFCALLVDIGLFERTIVRMQNAADAAAIGAVFAYQDGGTFASGGIPDATLNGFAAGSRTTVTLSNPPTSGAYSGNSYAVQALITQSATAVFLPRSFTLSARATAMRVPSPCVFMLAKFSTQPSLSILNQANQYTCPTYIGLSYNISGGSSSGSQYFVAANSANSSGSPSPSAIFGAPTLADPLSYLTPPIAGSCITPNSYSSSVTLNPGTYCGGLTLTGNGNMTFNAGTYIITGPLTINGPNLFGNGITFYVSAGSGSSNASSIQNVRTALSAPTSGPLQGILYYSDRSLAAGQANLSLSNWNPNSTLDGIFYLPNQEFIASNIPFKGNNYLGLVADYSRMNNVGFIPAANYSSLANGNPFHPVGGGGGIVE